MTSVRVRPAVASDLAALRVLYQQLDDVHGLAEPEVVPMHDQAPRAITDIRRQVDEDTVLVAEGPDGVVLGFAQMAIRDLGGYFQFAKVPEIENLAVLEGQRGRGVGRALMDAAEAWAVGAGYPEIWVDAWTFNEPAASLYRRQGFRPLSTRFRKRLSGGAADDTTVTTEP